MRITVLSIVVTLLAGAGFAALQSTAATPPNLERALAAQRALVAESPTDPQALNDLGNLLVLNGRSEEAEDAYRQALEAGPELAAAHYNLGLLLAESGRRKEAASRFKAVLDLEPDHAWAHYQLGAVLDARGSDSKAVRHYARAFRLDPQLAFREVNPHVIDNDHITEALLRAFQDMPASMAAPKTYEDPSRIVSLMISEQEGEEMESPSGEGETDEMVEPMQEELVGPEGQTRGGPATGAGPRPSLPPAEGDQEPVGGRVLREGDLEEERGLNQAAPTGGSVYYPPRGGVRSSPRSGAPSRYRPPTRPGSGSDSRTGSRQIQPDGRTQPTGRQRYTPGIPSTGRLEMELLPGPGDPERAERG